jgi:hypothetical protein
MCAQPQQAAGLPKCCAFRQPVAQALYIQVGSPIGNQFMAKIIMQNVKIKAANGGSIKNYESVEMNGVEMEFTGNAIDFVTDENVAIFRDAVKTMTPSEIIDLAKALQNQSTESQESVIKKSKLSKVLGYVKEVKPLVNWIIELGKNV